MKKQKMNAKKTLVFFLVMASILLATSIVSAKADLADITGVKINGLYDSGNQDISIIAGETAFVEVYFTALEDASDVRLEVTIEADKTDVDAETPLFDVEEGKRYVKRLKLEVPYELKDEVSDDIFLNIELWNGDYKTSYDEIGLRVQRPSYNAGVMSIETKSTVQPGETLPVEVVLKNIGYNYLDDLYLTISIPGLGITKTSYVGDLVALECTDDDGEYSCDHEDDEDSVRTRVYLDIPYDIDSGIYTIEAEATNDELTINRGSQIAVTNELPNKVIVGSTRKTAGVGETAEYSVLLINPTNSLKVYRITADSSEVSVDVKDNIVAVPAGSTRNVKITAQASESGEYTFNINVIDGSQIVETTTLTLEAEKQNNVADPVFVLTVILVIVFIVLLIILIVLLGRKPQKEEDYSESYY